ncbi:MAG: hypothetical protein GF364_10360 [Candidatus Lokiarchaeota archaeon]|nr:hypothetical protein [Candidatus Lokiarchaeota archaeon]
MVFWSVFSYSFVVALTGAMSPGPVLSYVIFNAIKEKERGFLVGLFVILGHAILELLLILILVAGLGPILENQIFVIIIGLLGGGLLIYFGGSIIYDLRKKRIDFSFLNPDAAKLQDQAKQNKLFNMHPILGGVMISISNPYWILWWATWGLNAMRIFNISFANPIAFWGFFIGHEMGDLVWYVPVATLVGFSGKIMTKKVYIAILVACSIFMIGFGLYLASSVF